MNMSINPTAFNLVGNTAENGHEDISDLDLQPVLYAGFKDLNKLRHDFPIVLGNYDDAGSYVLSLSDIINKVICEEAPPGVDGEFLRTQLLNLEKEIRTIVSKGAGISLIEAWEKATHTLRLRIGKGFLKAFDKCLEQVWGAFNFDGQIIDCISTVPMAMLRQAWAIDQKDKAHVSRKKVDELIHRLEHILGAGIKKTEETLSPKNLKESVGSSFENAFDFNVMSRVLMPANPRDPIPEHRRKRIHSTLNILQTQRFFKSAKWSQTISNRQGPYSFLFSNTAQAMRTIQNRMSEMVELTKAISIAELEIANRYKPSKHDKYFDAFDEASMLPEDINFFPTYLIWQAGGCIDVEYKARILELLSSGIPVKILVQSDDILAGLTGSKGQLPFSDASWQFANMAIGFNNVFVLQSSSANLYKMRDKVRDGLTYEGSALFNVFTGENINNTNNTNMSCYLSSAAATESRAFPTLLYDPSAGPDWASRLFIDGNPQKEKDWPIHEIMYEDEDLQKQTENITFTFVEFIVSDRRFSKFFARVPRSEWSNEMLPVGQYLKATPDEQEISIPYVLMVDGMNILHRLVIDDRLIRSARRCQDMWHSLQELGGVHNSYAQNLLEQERKRWLEEKEAELAELKNDAVPDIPTPSNEEKLETIKRITPKELEDDQDVSTDVPFIETPRCTTCNECTDINPQMFSYNDNKQAYIADLSAGTFRQMVEAAENCQVSIIHPGEPQDLNEPNLDELQERASLFN